jgi:hypothetical protein
VYGISVLYVRYLLDMYGTQVGSVVDPEWFVPFLDPTFEAITDLKPALDQTQTWPKIKLT